MATWEAPQSHGMNTSFENILPQIFFIKILLRGIIMIHLLATSSDSESSHHFVKQSRLDLPLWPRGTLY